MYLVTVSVSQAKNGVEFSSGPCVISFTFPQLSVRNFCHSFKETSDHVMESKDPGVQLGSTIGRAVSVAGWILGF